MIPGQTSVTTSLFGCGAIDGIGRELGRFVVTPTEVPWRLAQPRLGANPPAVILVDTMEVETPGRPAFAPGASLESPGPTRTGGHRRRRAR